MAKELDFFNELLKETENEWASVVDEIESTERYVNTGSMTLNALLSGSLYGGAPDNTVTAFAGLPSTGKTFYAISVVKQLLESDPNALIFYFESENAITKRQMENRGLDTSRVALVPVGTVQEFSTQALRIVNKYIDTAVEKRRPVMFVLDSLGNLSTEKEMEDVASGKNVRDMTRAQLIRGAFRVLILKLGKAHIPMIATNHVYEVIGSYVPLKKMNGGSGLEYAGSQIVFLDKKVKKQGEGEDKVSTGVIISAVLKKSRLTIENKKVETYLDYRHGLDPYYGLVDLGVKLDVLKKVSTKIEFPDGSSEFEKRIEKDPTKFFNKEILDKIEGACADEFFYGKTNALAAPTGEEK